MAAMVKNQKYKAKAAELTWRTEWLFSGLCDIL